MNGDKVSASYDANYFDCIGAEYIPKEIKKIIGKKISQKIFIEYKHTIQ